MNRFITALILAIGVVSTPMIAKAQPSAADLAAAKKAFGEAQALFDKQKYEAAVEKFLESYRLSKKPVLLYNVALAYEANKDTDLAVLYFKKFLKEAPADAAQRPDGEARLKALEGGGTATTPDKQPDKQPTAPVVIKPAGTYSATDFQHQTVMEAPPGKPLDVTASIPEDSGWTVTLFYRGAGDTKFYTKVMKNRYRELVARIPAQKMGGQSIQYYIEVKDQGGAVVTRAAKSTSPNLVAIEQTATARFYPDWSDEDGGTAATPTQLQHQDTEEDPLNKKKTPPKVEDPLVGPVVGPEGPSDTGAPESKTMKYLRFGTTGGAVVFLGLSVLFYVQAGNYANTLADDINKCDPGMTAPCHPFDSFDKDLQDTGKQRELFSRITLAAGVATAGVAGYLWYKSMKAKKAHASSGGGSSPAPGPAPKEPVHDELGWIITPSVSDGYAGAAALVRF